ncbi:hypothetical protein JCM11672_25640 [Alkaliphilus crotonatoxidans]
MPPTHLEYMAEKRFVNKKIGSRPIFCKPDCNHLEFIHFIALYILISIERVAFRFAIKESTKWRLKKKKRREVDDEKAKGYEIKLYHGGIYLFNDSELFKCLLDVS